MVNTLLTMHSLPKIASNSAEKKPEVILYYNSTKSGVNILNRILDNSNVHLQEDD